MIIRNKIIPDADVYYYYMLKHTGQIFQIGKKYSAPYRRDEDPSFSTKQYEDGKIRWKDFGKKQKGTDCVALVQHIYDCSRSEAKKIIWRDIVEEKPEIPEIKVKPPTDKTNYKLDHAPLNNYEKVYWSVIRESTLEKFRVRGVRYSELNGLPSIKSYPKHPTYVYLLGDHSFQMYRPSQHRFKSWNVYHTLFGYDQLPETGDLLVITSSMKDVITLYELGIPAIAPTSEGVHNFLVSKKEELEDRFTTILILFDADTEGVGYAEDLEDRTNWEAVFPVFPVHSKDPSDVLWRHGLPRLRRVLMRHEVLERHLTKHAA